MANKEKDSKYYEEFPDQAKEEICQRLTNYLLCHLTRDHLAGLAAAAVGKRPGFLAVCYKSEKGDFRGGIGRMNDMEDKDIFMALFNGIRLIPNFQQYLDRLDGNVWEGWQ